MLVNANKLNLYTLCKCVLTDKITINDKLHLNKIVAGMRRRINTYLDDIMQSINAELYLNISKNTHTILRDADSIEMYKIMGAKQDIISYPCGNDEIFIILDSHYEIEDIFSDSDDPSVLDDFIETHEIYFSIKLNTYDDCKRLCRNIICPILNEYKSDIRYIANSIFDIVVMTPFDDIQKSVILSTDIETSIFDINVNNQINTLIESMGVDDVSSRYVYVLNPYTISILRNAMYDTIKEYIGGHSENRL